MVRAKIAQGLTLAARAGAAPALIGMRWARSQTAAPEVPPHRWNLALASKVALDEFFFASEVTLGAFVGMKDRRRVSTELAEAEAFYDANGWIDDPDAYHVGPPSLQETEIRDAHLRSHGLDYQHLTYESRYEPHPGEPGRERWLDYAPCRDAHAWLLEHPGPSRPWLVCIPGYRMGHPMVDFAGFRARYLYRQLGINVAIPVMPLHGPRRIGRRGGDGFFSGDFIDTIHAQTQGVWDVRRLVGWLRARGAPGVGAYGVSLGGYTTALLASVDGDLECVIAGNPATDFLGLVLKHVPPLLVRGARSAGFPIERIRRILRVISPLVLHPRVPHERRYVYAGLVDQLTSPDQAHALWTHWERPRVAWYHGGHVSFLWEREVAELLREALAESNLLPERS